MHGFCPAHTTKSMDNFVLYYASPFIAKYDSKTEQYIKTSPTALVQKLVFYMQALCLMGAIHSVFITFPDTFIQFGEPFDKNVWYSWYNIFRWRQLWENLCFAGKYMVSPCIVLSVDLQCTYTLAALFPQVFFQTYLATCASGLQLMTMLVTGLELEEMWINPLSKSASFSDFWGRRWNLSVHNALKRGVFQPVRRYYPKYVALSAAFLASGVFHEWLVWLVFSPLPSAKTISSHNEDCTDWKCYTPTYGPAIIFFVFQGLLVAIEFSTAQYYMSLIQKSVPGPIATLLIVCIGGSMAHLFSDAYVNSSFFVGGRVAYILIRPLGQSSY